MKKQIILVCIASVALLSFAWAGPSVWDVIQTPTTEVFNGVSAPNSGFSIAVGKNGTIVNRMDGDNGTLMNSGTDKELFDVYAASENFAIATGEDIVLLWDGSSWSTIVDGQNAGLIYTGAWAPSQQDVAFFGQLGQFGFICPHIPNAPKQPFCRAYFSDAMLTACGESNDVKFLMASGDILHTDNFLLDLSGTAPLHEQNPALALTAIWTPATACQMGSIKPLQLFAIQGGNEFWYFDGSNWVDMNVAIPQDQTLTWIGGAHSNQVIAVGFKADGKGGNEGVVWSYNGSNWTELNNLPDNVPGLTDVAVNVALGDLLFADGFEVLNSFRTSDPPKIDILASAETGRYLFSSEIFAASQADLRINKRLITPQPIRTGDRITFQIVIQNLTQFDVTDIRFLDGHNGNIQWVSDTCGLSLFNVQFGWSYRDLYLPLLAGGDTFFCTMDFDVVGIENGLIRNYAVITETDESNYRNNRSEVRALIKAP